MPPQHSVSFSDNLGLRARRLAADRSFNPMDISTLFPNINIFISLLSLVGVSGKHLCSFGRNNDCSLWTYSSAFFVSSSNWTSSDDQPSLVPVRKSVLLLKFSDDGAVHFLPPVVESVWLNKSSATCSFIYDLIILRPETIDAFEVLVQRRRNTSDHVLWSTKDDPPFGISPSWHRHRILIGAFTEPFRLLLEVLVRQSVTNDTVILGIDNLHLDQCFPDTMKDDTCPPGTFPCRPDAICLPSESLCDFTPDCSDGSDEADVCDALPEGSQCDFEDDLCGWIPSSVDGWLRSTAADVSGSPPFNDHTIKASNGSLLAINFGELKDKSASYRIRSRIFQRFTNPKKGHNVDECSLISPRTCATSDNNLVRFVAGLQFKVRFYYRISGHLGTAGVILVAYHAEESAGEGQVLWRLTARSEHRVAEPWKRVSVTVPETYHRFYIQFVEVGGIRKGAFVIDDVSLSWGCYFPGVNGSSRSIRPNPRVPDIRFNISDCLTNSCLTGVSRVENDRVLPDGVLRWIVPVSGVYRITAQGAWGGGEFDRMPGSACRGSQSSSFVHLGRQTTVLFVVSQAGQAACTPTVETATGGTDNICGEGGGGGGGSFVYKKVDGPGRPERYEVFVAAQGGNGHSASRTVCSSTPQKTKSCVDKNQPRNGGFGGGGKSCGSQGGAGGWHFALERTSMETSSHFRLSDSGRSSTGEQDGNGWVSVRLMCKCRVDCVLDEAKLTFICPTQAEQEETVYPEDKTVQYVLSAVVFVLGLGGILLCLFMASRKDAVKQDRHGRGLRSCMTKFSQAEYGNIPLHSLRDDSSSTMLPMMETNQLYELSGVRTFEDVRRIPGNSLTITQPIGRGAFGTVYQGTMQTQKVKAIVALKMLNKSSEAEVDFATEALIISKFHHPNIVACFGLSVDFEPSCIVLELLPGGDVKAFLQRCRNAADILSTNMNELLDIAIDIAKGCQYLEEHRFVHRDIAARNCLLTSNEKGRTAKIADFGMARDVFRSEYYRRNASHLLPVKWMAPESVTEGLFSSKSDAWSFGVLLWEVFSLGCSPYPGLGNQEVMAFVCNGGRLNTPSQYCPDELFELMQKCWLRSSMGRASFSVVLERLLKLEKLTSVTSARLPAAGDAPLPLLSVSDCRSIS